MGYDMTYARVIHRNHLVGGYDRGSEGVELGDRRMLMGDLRRLEHDQQDPLHLRDYAHLSGATEEQVQAIFAKFFEYVPWEPAWANPYPTANPDTWTCMGRYITIKGPDTLPHRIDLGDCERCVALKEQQRAKPTP